MFISTLNFFTIFILSTVFLFLSFANAEFYKYVDKNGNVRYVDDLGLVPKKDRGDIVTYEEKYDRLSPEKRAAMIENEREFEKARKEFKKNKDAEKARREYLKKMTTPVRILQNQVFVPVTLGYKHNKIRALLLLDTGASIIALHKKAADNLHIRKFTRGKAQVAGGKQVDVMYTKLSYVTVGPYTKKNLMAGIIDFNGKSSGFNGLLGMNFLKNLKYEINFEKQVIIWKP